jgi:hypothetical protein
MGSMTRTTEQTIIAILVERLGGEVIITDHDMIRADNLELTTWDRPATLDYKLTATRPPVTLDGEIVEDEPKALGTLRHQHETWQIRTDGRGGRYCAACGATI